MAKPFFLVYANKVVIPIELEIPYLRIIQELKLSNAKLVQMWFENLAFIDGTRINVVYHGQLYQNRMVIVFNKKVIP